MSQEKIEALRRIYSERARGDFTGGRELVAEEAVISWEIPEGSFLSQWESFVTEADEFIELDERSILVVGRMRGRGHQSGADVEARTFEIWTFKDGKVIGQHQSFDRERALEAAGVSE